MYKKLKKYLINKIRKYGYKRDLTYQKWYFTFFIKTHFFMISFVFLTATRLFFVNYWKPYLSKNSLESYWDNFLESPSFAYILAAYLTVLFIYFIFYYHRRLFYKKTRIMPAIKLAIKLKALKYGFYRKDLQESIKWRKEFFIAEYLAQVEDFFSQDMLLEIFFIKLTLFKKLFKESTTWKTKLLMFKEYKKYYLKHKIWKYLNYSTDFHFSDTPHIEEIYPSLEEKIIYDYLMEKVTREVYKQYYSNLINKYEEILFKMEQDEKRRALSILKGEKIYKKSSVSQEYLDWAEKELKKDTNLNDENK